LSCDEDLFMNALLPEPPTEMVRSDLGFNTPRFRVRDMQATTDVEQAPPLEINVLAVDDQPSNLLALEAVLADLKANLVKATSGAEALGHLLQKEFAVILMDVKMPGMDGFETAELIRKRSRSRHTPIIFLTAWETADEQMLHGYALGAVDYLRKPLVPEVLHSKVSVFVDIFRKTEQIKRQAERLRRLEQREHERELAETKARWEAERLRTEIRLARQVQQKLFPVAPLPVAGFDIAGASFPAEATGGDYFDYIPMLDGTLAVVIGDVSGHGFGPALLMAELRAYLRAFLLTRTDVGEIVQLLNRTLAADTDERFATLLLASLDPRTRSFVYASAGHSQAFLFDATGAVKSQLHCTGLPLATLPDGDFDAGPAQTLQPGEMVLFFTDGLAEAHSLDENMFGTERLLQFVQAHRQRSAREIVHGLYHAVRDFCGPSAQMDDMTAILIKVEADV
jgi:serine phosphatase RsbU (regulator of sigma subunit)